MTDEERAIEEATKIVRPIASTDPPVYDRDALMRILSSHRTVMDIAAAERYADKIIEIREESPLGQVWALSKSSLVWHIMRGDIGADHLPELT